MSTNDDDGAPPDDEASPDDLDRPTLVGIPAAAEDAAPDEARDVASRLGGDPTAEIPLPDDGADDLLDPAHHGAAGTLHDAAGGLGTVGDVSGGVGSAARGMAGSDLLPQEVRDVAGTVGTIASVASTASRIARPLVDGLASLVERGPGIQPVDFDLAVDGASGWKVRRLKVREAIGELYEAVLDIVHDDAEAEPRELLGKDARLLLSRPQEPPERGAPFVRRLAGIVHRIEHHGVRLGHATGRIHLGPALGALEHFVGSAIWQDQTVPDIVGDVLTRRLGPHRRSVRWELDRVRYPRREYVVQYRETDLSFVRRLLEREGLSFYFDHAAHAEELVIVDRSHTFPECELMDPPPVEIGGPDADLADRETFRSFRWGREIGPARTIVRDLDWTRPQAAIEADESTMLEPAEGEIYQHHHAVLGDYQGSQYRRHDAVEQATLWAERQIAHDTTTSGHGNVIGLRPGTTFELTGHRDPGMNRRHLVTAVEHEGVAPEEIPDGTNAVERRHRRYHNAVRTTLADLHYRPLLCAKHPRVQGPLTATVVGEGSEEIHTDVHGRVRVKFHWDRAAPSGQDSCWMRVAQTWAGQGFGAVVLPRVGMEVVVDFLEGDPERPLVVGVVYDGAHVPPYPLPEHKTRSVFRTRSSPDPGSDGHNELMFEDLAGDELVFVRAQKDLREQVLHDHTTRVGNDQANVVEQRHTEQVGATQSLQVGGSRSKRVGGDESRSVGGDRSASVGRDDSLTVAHDRRVEIGANQTYQVRANLQRITTGHEHRYVGDGRATEILADDLHTVQLKHAIKAGVVNELRQGDANVLVMEGDHVELRTPQYTKIITPAATLEVSKAGTIQAVADTSIVLRVGASVLKVAPDGVTISAPKIHLLAGEAQLVLQPGSAELTAANVGSRAAAVNEIVGALVKIN